MGEVIDGKAVARGVKERLGDEVRRMKRECGFVPGLAVILVGEDPASQIYVRNKGRACDEVGIRSMKYTLDADSGQDELVGLISDLNSDSSVHGILVQLPLPGHMDEDAVIEAISPDKDVDGFHPYNVGRLLVGSPVLEPCTPLGIMKLIDSTGVDLEGREAVVVGRSNIVGKPAAVMLLRRNATVTICHSRTRDIAARVASADVVVAAVGRPEFVRGEWIKPGAVVIDVGINRTAEGKLVGDVQFDEARERASYITPVPGGVGPMTIAMLLHNTVDAARRSAGLCGV
ncbi:MAG TPA: bifunctional methylenetetrahydrofolate dehydrogenase/methenyltetrahydrofolate cyclohydrolase FolD [Deltaproteobacteria bacterium]|nr:bifunctional methylenetetrahydrofolate dehydrogenase/methenyltetrahydrofolate cyclohydrolase FolD [Deltaproteobacteria bacterium]